MTYEEVQKQFMQISDGFREQIQFHCDTVDEKAKRLVNNRWGNDAEKKE